MTTRIDNQEDAVSTTTPTRAPHSDVPTGHKDEGKVGAVVRPQAAAQVAAGRLPQTRPASDDAEAPSCSWSSSARS